MSVSLVVIRLELADQSPSPQGFQYSAGELRYSALKPLRLCQASLEADHHWQESTYRLKILFIPLCMSCTSRHYVLI